MSTVISAFGSGIIEFNIKNSMFNMDYIMRENNVYDDRRNVIKKDYEDRDKCFSYYEYM